MKRLIAFAVFSISCLSVLAQSDTLYTAEKKIPAKIIEIGETEIKYQKANLADGPIYVIDKSNVLRYKLANGYTEILRPDELSIDHQHKEILGSRQVVKVHPFSLLSNHVSLAYEKVLKVGTNLDVEVGLINSNITLNPIFGRGASRSYGGMYVKPGFKFLLGQDFSVKGMKYSHPLKGRYIRLDAAFSYLNYQNIDGYFYNPSTNVPQVMTTDMNAVSFGAFVNYGRQFILGNILTLDYYFGVGVTGVSYTYSNPEFTKANSSYFYQDIGASLYNFYGFMRIPKVGLSGTFGFRIGYIIPERKDKRNSEAIKKK